MADSRAAPAIDQAIFDMMKADRCEAVIVQPIFTGFQDKIVPLAMNANTSCRIEWSMRKRTRFPGGASAHSAHAKA
jgi:hypothetical protein